MESKSKKSAISIVIIVILALVVVFLSAYILMGYAGNKKTNISLDKFDKNSGASKDVNEDVNKSNDTTISSDTKLELEDMMYFIFGLDFNTGSMSTYNFNKNYVKNGLTDDNKLEVALENSNWTQYLTPSSQVDSLVRNGENALETDSRNVNRIYKSLFGENIKSFKSFDSKCPSYLYDGMTGKYYSVTAGCGGTSMSRVIFYDYDAKEDNDTASLYVAMGIIEFDGSGINDKVYSDLDEAKLLTTTTTDYSVNKDNYQSFDKYKFVFKKNGNSFYFDKVEKIN